MPSITSIRSTKKMQAQVRTAVTQGQTIGLVPTMGYLHEGHVDLVRRAARQVDLVVVSIFVNPTQFAPEEDLGLYPRDEKGDLRKAVEAGAGMVFLPKATEIYPDDFQTWVEVERLTKVLEGKARPDHFRGVTTIVAKLYNICRPDVVVFGMKDFQQAAVLRQMTHDLGYPIKFIVAPTKRQRGGLAMSSRNKYLSQDQQRQARCLYQALRTAKAMVLSGLCEGGAIRGEMKGLIRAACAEAEVEYISFNDIKTLKSQIRVEAGTVCSLAARLFGVRLIDNMRLK